MSQGQLSNSKGGGFQQLWVWKQREEVCLGRVWSASCYAKLRPLPQTSEDFSKGKH
jgi:hypothetical protein